jgi:Asp-tRNA(Asn)/Glu-tRNA(Gln) amidotransferase B subunit
MTLDDACLEVSQTPEFRKLQKDRAKLINYLMGQTMKRFPNYNPAMVRKEIARQIDA